MGRVPHYKSANQGTLPNNVRGSRIAKNRKNHKVVIEKNTKGQEASRATLSFHAEPPPGYTFIPAGNPQLTSALKEFAKRGNHQILAVTTTPHASRHELSREVHRVGFHFPTEVVSQVCNHYGIRLTSGGKLVEEKDDDKLFMRLYQKGQLVLDEKVRDQVTINTEAKQIIQDLFPKIPDNDLYQIIKTAFQLGDGKVGTADEIPLVRRAQLSVVAHLRHTYTNYDKLLRSVPYSEARHQVEDITLQKLIAWRGDGEDDKQAMDDTLREVVVISDEEDHDEVEDGQVLEHEELQVQPVRHGAAPPPAVNGRPQAPVDVDSEDEHSRGFRYVPQVVRRLPVPDAPVSNSARQQSRYAVWDRMREEYRNGLVNSAPRVLERIMIDEPAPVLPQTTYVTREPLYIPEPAPRRIVEPIARAIPSPSSPRYIRGADGKLYERISATSQPLPPNRPLRIRTPPPLDRLRQHDLSQQLSPRTQPHFIHRRTESYDNVTGTVLPSIEEPSTPYTASNPKYNPFNQSEPATGHHSVANHDFHARPAPLIDLTDSAEAATKRRRFEEQPLLNTSSRATEQRINQLGDREWRVNMRYNDEHSARSSRQQGLIPLEIPSSYREPQTTYQTAPAGTQSTVIYQEELDNRGISSPARYRGDVIRQSPIEHVAFSKYAQPARQVEYASAYEQNPARVVRQMIPVPSMDGGSEHADRVSFRDLSITSRPNTYQSNPLSSYRETRNRDVIEVPSYTIRRLEDNSSMPIPGEYVFAHGSQQPIRSGEYQAVGYQPIRNAHPDAQVPPTSRTAAYR